jgi:hypothetical protein
MSSTIELLKLLGSPFAGAMITDIDLEMLKRLYFCAKKNRISFFYLETIKNNYGKTLNNLFNEESAKFSKINKAITKLSKTLATANIRHTFFKTIRPYKSTTVDLDVLILENYSKIFEVMQRAGYKLLARGPKSTTFWDSEAQIGVDLYDQVAVSYVTYMDKQTLINHVATASTSDGKQLSVLDFEADLACIIAHSLAKEQLYVLSEYYTFLYYLKRINIDDFVEIARQNNIISSVKTHLTLTALLHKVAHHNTPEKLQQILDQLGEENFERARMIKNNFGTPYKYHPITVIRSLLEITKGNETRKSIATQLIHMFNPNFSKDFLRKIIGNVKRETY